MSELGGQPNRIEKNTKIKGDIVSEADFRIDGKLDGKCGLCEYKKVCMGCRARAFADTHDYMAEEPNCQHVPIRIQREQS